MTTDPRVIADYVIPAGGSWSGVVRDGETFRIIDAEGQQAVDFICFSAEDSSESYELDSHDSHLFAAVPQQWGRALFEQGSAHVLDHQ